MTLSGERLKELRMSKGVTQKQMAEVLGITERNYRRYEAGGMDPHTSVAIAISDYFDVSIDYLFSRSNDPVRR